MTALLRAGDPIRGERGREYRILEWRAEGSYARVYRAEPISDFGFRISDFGTGVTSKLLRPGIAKSEIRNPKSEIPAASFCAVKLAKTEVPGAGERVEREHTVRGRVRHPGLAELWDFGRWAGVPFLVLAWIDGNDLRQLLERQRRLPLATALGYLQDVAAAVAALHAGGLSHGDLRPENIVVESATRRAVLVDLGEAAESEGSSRPGQSQGDLRALGGLLAFMLTGERGETASPRLTSANGYNPGAIRLWEEARAGRLTAAALQKRTAALLKEIGAPMRDA